MCHGGSGPASRSFAVAGTVYQAQSGEVVPQTARRCTVVDTNGSQATATTNAAGNFWVLESHVDPDVPRPRRGGRRTATSRTPMFTHIGRDGSCATCHSDPPGGDLVGHIFLAPGDEPDGGFPDGGP